MATIASAYLNSIVNYLRGAGAPTAISAIYIDLYAGDPQESGSSVLSTITGSATRPNITSAMAAASGGVSRNSSTSITITEAAVGAAVITDVAIFDAATSGNLIMSKALPAQVAVNVLDSVTVANNNLAISIS